MSSSSSNPLAPSSTCTPANLSQLAAAPVPALWDWQGWFVLIAIVVMFVVLLRGTMRTEFAVVMCVASIAAAQIITVDEALAGFANSGVMVVTVLYPVAEALSATGGIDYLMGKLMGKPQTLGMALLRMMLPVVMASAFINNTPLVALMVPIIQKWSRKVNLPPSQLMIPLSYASILGGSVSMLGSSTNLVVGGRAWDFYCEHMGVFAITPAGVPVALAGLTYILAFAPYLLPDAAEYQRRTMAKQRKASRRGRSGQGAVAPAYSRARNALCSIPGIATIAFWWARLRRRVFTGEQQQQQQQQHRDENATAPSVSSLRATFASGEGGDANLSFSFSSITGSSFSSSRNKDSVAFTGHMLPDAESDGLVSSADASVMPMASLSPDDEIGFILHAVVLQGSRVAGRSIADAGLRALDGLFLISVQRGNVLFSAVGPTFQLEVNDILSFSGVADNFVSFCAQKDITPVAVESDYDDDDGSNDVVRVTPVVADPVSSFTIQAIVCSNSTLVGKSPKEAAFRRTYGATILSIYRAGERLREPRLGRVPLKVGDVLVCVTAETFDWDDEVTQRDLKPRVDAEQARLIRAQDAVAPERTANVDREFLISMQVAANSKLTVVGSLVGKSVEASGINTLPGVQLVALERDGATERSVSTSTVLRANDVLWFVGERDGIGSLRRVPGLEDHESKELSKLQVITSQRRLVEVVLSLRSDMLYKTVREARVRTRFGAAIVAIHRHGARLLCKIGDVVLKPGDVLILDTGPDFVSRCRDDSNFLLVSEIESSTPPRFDKFYIAFATCVAMVLVSATLNVDMVLCATIALIIMLFANCLDGDRVLGCVNWSVIITVACAFGLSTALQNTSIAPIFGNALVQLARVTNTGGVGVLTTLMAATALLSSLVANNAAALLMFPIGAQAAAQVNIPPVQMLFALMFGASDYATPFGYQTNLMVYGPGGYIFSDYMKMGAPLMIWLLIVQAIVISFLDYWYISWIVAFSAFFGVILADLTFRGNVGVRHMLSCSRNNPCCCARARPHHHSNEREVDVEEDAGTVTSAAGTGVNDPTNNNNGDALEHRETATRVHADAETPGEAEAGVISQV